MTAQPAGPENYAEEVGSAGLINNHMEMVRRLAWHISGRVTRTIEVDDLIQIGMVALVEAAHAYEQRADAVFEAYASVRVRGAMIDEMRRRANMSRGALKRRRDYLNMQQLLEARLGRASSDDELAAALDLSAAEFADLTDEIQGYRYSSLDEAYSEQSMWFASDEESPFDAAVRSDVKDRLAALIADLPEREATVLQLYFVEELNLAEIGEILGIGAARVCQIKAAALKTLRVTLSDQASETE